MLRWTTRQSLPLAHFDAPGSPHAPLFAIKERTASPRRLDSMIIDVLANVGYEIEPDSLIRRPPPHVEWLDRHGITIALA